jgi:hypothetical protein
MENKKIYDLDTVIDFGKRFRGKTIDHILDTDPTYIRWALENVEHFSLSEDAQLFYDREIKNHAYKSRID